MPKLEINHVDLYSGLGAFRYGVHLAGGFKTVAIYEQELDCIQFQCSSRVYPVGSCDDINGVVNNGKPTVITATFSNRYRQKTSLERLDYIFHALRVVEPFAFILKASTGILTNSQGNFLRDRILQPLFDLGYSTSYESLTTLVASPIDNTSVYLVGMNNYRVFNFPEVWGYRRQSLESYLEPVDNIRELKQLLVNLDYGCDCLVKRSSTAKKIKTHARFDGGNVIHLGNSMGRLLTVRELLRLSGFSDEFPTTIGSRSWYIQKLEESAHPLLVKVLVQNLVKQRFASDNE